MAKRKTPPDELLRILYIDERLSTTQIGKMFGVAHKNVSLALRKAGIETRKEFRGPTHPSWKGGRLYKDGYVVVWMPNHHRADTKGYVREHILMAENHFGRELEEDEVVHHKNEIKDDNEPENLFVLTRLEHSLLHNKKVVCSVCGNPAHSLGYCQKHLARFKKYGNPRISKLNRYALPIAVE